MTSPEPAPVSVPKEASQKSLKEKEASKESVKSSIKPPKSIEVDAKGVMHFDIADDSDPAISAEPTESPHPVDLFLRDREKSIGSLLGKN